MLVHLKTLGCRLNEAETESWASDFQQLGHQIVNDESSADVLVINTCAVTQSAVRKSRQLIRKLHKKNAQAKLVVSGCYATLNSEEAVQTDGVDLLVNNQDKNRLAQLTQQHLAIESMPVLATEPNEDALFSRGRQRAFVKVQDGCRYRCSFCIVTIARGSEKSTPIAKLIDEVNTLGNSGVSEIVITGVHLGGYGSDTDSNLYQLVSELLDKTDMPRIRMGSLEPWDLPANFFNLFDNDRLMPHVHLPLQSGSDSVLRRMARRCKTAEFRELVANARHTVKNLNISTDIIVGFPGETEQDWQQTLDFVKEIGFNHIHIFTYSKREGTKAATLPDQVDEKIKKARSKQLHLLAQQQKLAAMAAAQQQTHAVLWEDRQADDQQGNAVYFGYTPNYLRVKATVEPSIELTNTVTLTKIINMTENVMDAEIID